MADGSTRRCCGGANAETLYVTTQAVERQLGDVSWAVYRFGDEMQRGIVDLAFDVAAASIDAAAMRAAAVAGDVGDGLRRVASADGLRVLVQQARNNFEVYNLVKNVRSRVRVDDAAPEIDLAGLVGTAYGLGAYADLWAIEGIGHDYAALRLDRDRCREGILRDGPAARLPERSLTMMHAGLGLALAERTLRRLTPYSSTRSFRTTAAEFLAACDAHGRPGYRGAAYESLGLVARTWHPQLVAGVDAALRGIDERAAGYFWHGAGRALYFLPAYIVPVLSPWRAAGREAPHDLARRNLRAGVAWAWTLVNIRRPEILGELLSAHGAADEDPQVLANAIASALVVAIDITPDDPYVAALAEYAPPARDTAAFWGAIVSPAARTAVTRYAPLLRMHAALDAVFQYCDLPALAQQLERGSARHAERAQSVTRATEAS